MDEPYLDAHIYLKEDSADLPSLKAWPVHPESSTDLGTIL